MLPFGVIHYNNKIVSIVLYKLYRVGLSLQHCIITSSTTVTDSARLIVYPTDLSVWNNLLFALCDNLLVVRVRLSETNYTVWTAVSVILPDRIFVIA